ncbi:MAG: hypothetical protein H0W72_15455, partial [Planctomycetes bacterium]|nr:hypothetical protein [Planctomycetota bacterium]
MPDPRATSDACAPTVQDRRSRLRRVPALGVVATLLALCAPAQAEQGEPGVQADQLAPA